MENMLSVDIENWHDSRIDKGIDIGHFKNYKFDFADSVYRTLDIFSRFGVKATFFVLASVAKEYPDPINRIHADGHEIASHGYIHQFIYKQTRKQFEGDLILSKKILEDITGAGIFGYRAPSFSITRDSLWALEIIRESGFLYDASISPSKNYLYGLPGSPRHPFTIKIKENVLLPEFPQTTANIFNFKIPFCGGFFLRMFPYSLVKRNIGLLNKNGHPAIVYFHPHEIDSFRIPAKILSRENIILNFRKKTMEKKIKSLLADFSFTTLAKAVKKYTGDRIVSIEQLNF